MSLRTYAIPLALVSLGIGLGVVSDQPPEPPGFEAPMAEVLGAEPVPSEAAPAEAAPVGAEPVSDPQAAAPEPALQAAAPEPMEAPEPVYDQTPIPITDSYYGESIPVDAADVPPDEVPITDLPDGILPNGVVEGQPYPPSEGEAPYQVVTTNPMACVPEGAPGCSSGAYCCSELVCVQDVCVQSH